MGGLFKTGASITSPFLLQATNPIIKRAKKADRVLTTFFFIFWYLFYVGISFFEVLKSQIRAEANHCTSVIDYSTISINEYRTFLNKRRPIVWLRYTSS